MNAYLLILCLMYFITPQSEFSLNFGLDKSIMLFAKARQLYDDYWEGQRARALLKEKCVEAAEKHAEAMNSDSKNAVPQKTAVQVVTVQPTKELSTLEKADKVANILGTGVLVGKTAYDAGNGAYRYIYPSDEEKLHAENVKLELKRVRARHAIRECMVRNRKTAKDEENVPYVCREKFDEFVTVATEKEIDETKRLVNLR